MSNEQLYYDTLKAIARHFMTVDQLRRSADGVGLSAGEHIEMAYENIQELAKRTIKGKRRPKDISTS